MARVKNKEPIFFRRGRHVVDYRDEYGNRFRESFESKKDASAYWQKVLAQRNGKTIAQQIAQTPLVPLEIKKSIQQYRKMVEVRRAKQTIMIERYSFEEIYVHLRNECKVEFVHEIKQFHLESFQAAQADKGLKASSINRKFNSYRAWLNKCVSWGLIAKSPMSGLTKLEEIPPDIKTWSDTKFNDAIKVVPAYMRDVLLFFERTGRRPIDAARAVFGDIDEARRTIKVKSFKGGKIKAQYFQLTDDLFERIIEIRSLRKASEADFIFLNARGKPITTNGIGLALRRSGIRDVTSYGLRHTFINGLVDDGVQPRDIQLLAGHAKFETTIGYTHRDTKDLKKHVEKRAENRSLLRVV